MRSNSPEHLGLSDRIADWPARSARTGGRPLFAVAAPVALFVAALALSGCNTTEGIGEDIEAAGESLDEAAEDAN